MIFHRFFKERESAEIGVLKCAKLAFLTRQFRIFATHIARRLTACGLLKLLIWTYRVRALVLGDPARALRLRVDQSRPMARVLKM